MAWWPWRKTSEPAVPATAAARPAPSPDPGWRGLPAIQRVVDPLQLTAPVGRLTAALSTWADPRLGTPMGHLVDPTGPAGRVEGLVEPAPGPTVRTDGPGLPLAPAPNPTGRRTTGGGTTVQRLVASADGPAPTATGPVHEQGTPRWSLPVADLPASSPGTRATALTQAAPVESAPAHRPSVAVQRTADAPAADAPADVPAGEYLVQPPMSDSAGDAPTPGQQVPDAQLPLGTPALPPPVPSPAGPDTSPGSVPGGGPLSTGPAGSDDSGPARPLVAQRTTGLTGAETVSLPPGTTRPRRSRIGAPLTGPLDVQRQAAPLPVARSAAAPPAHGPLGQPASPGGAAPSAPVDPPLVSPTGASSPPPVPAPPREKPTSTDDVAQRGATGVPGAQVDDVVAHRASEGVPEQPDGAAQPVEAPLLGARAVQRISADKPATDTRPVGDIAEPDVLVAPGRPVRAAGPGTAVPAGGVDTSTPGSGVVQRAIIRADRPADVLTDRLAGRHADAAVDESSRGPAVARSSAGPAVLPGGATGQGVSVQRSSDGPTTDELPPGTAVAPEGTSPDGPGHELGPRVDPPSPRLVPLLGSRPLVGSLLPTSRPLPVQRATGGPEPRAAQRGERLDVLSRAQLQRLRIPAAADGASATSHPGSAGGGRLGAPSSSPASNGATTRFEGSAGTDDSTSISVDQLPDHRVDQSPDSHVHQVPDHHVDHFPSSHVDCSASPRVDMSTRGLDAAHDLDAGTGGRPVAQRSAAVAGWPTGSSPPAGPSNPVPLRSANPVLLRSGAPVGPVAERGTDAVVQRQMDPGSFAVAAGIAEWDGDGSVVFLRPPSAGPLAGAAATSPVPVSAAVTSGLRASAGAPSPASSTGEFPSWSPSTAAPRGPRAMIGPAGVGVQRSATGPGVEPSSAVGSGPAVRPGRGAAGDATASRPAASWPGLPLQRQEAATEAAVERAEAPAAATAAPDAVVQEPELPAPGTGGPVPATTAPAPAPAATPPTDLDELARRLFDPLSARLRAELRLDRERAGVVTDLRH